MSILVVIEHMSSMLVSFCRWLEYSYLKWKIFL